MFSGLRFQNYVRLITAKYRPMALSNVDIFELIGQVLISVRFGGGLSLQYQNADLILNYVMRQIGLNVLKVGRTYHMNG